METIRNTFWPECAEKVSTPLVVEENSCDCEVFKASSVADTESPEYFSNWWVFQMSFLIAWRPQTQCFIALWFWQRSLRHIHQNLGKCYQIICITGCTPPGVCCFVIWVKWPFYFKQPVHLGDGGRGGGHLQVLSPPWSVIFVSPQGGTQQLSECLAERIGWKNVRLGSAVTAIWQVEYSNSSLRDWWGATQR